MALNMDIHNIVSVEIEPVDQLSSPHSTFASAIIIKTSDGDEFTLGLFGKTAQGIMPKLVREGA